MPFSLPGIKRDREAINACLMHYLNVILVTTNSRSLNHFLNATRLIDENEASV